MIGLPSQGVDMSAEASKAAMALFALIADPAASKARLAELQKATASANEAVAKFNEREKELQGLNQASDVRLNAALAAERELTSKNAAMEREAEAKKKQLEDARKKLEADRSAFLAEKELHGKWHTERTEYFEKERRIIDRGHAELSIGKKEAAQTLSMAKEIRAAGEALKDKFEAKLAEFKKIVG